MLGVVKIMTYYRDKNKALNEAEKRSRKTGQQQFVYEHVDGSFAVSSIDSVEQQPKTENSDLPIDLILALVGAKRWSFKCVKN